ncbi:ribonuclease P protein subunit p30 [Pseudomyrmex gracilis]|uniref:ribonuclease P protein subunit p30 n=1 Tax=Pseudomyrmex gracilis TaxID=219809 RepID=UPI000994EAF3|nr:ribonuclease P protein subunit p30 [Pseudomyrmex gracilis]
MYVVLKNSSEQTVRVDFCRKMDLKPSDGYFDLCINVTSENIDCLDDILSRLYQMGYRTVALNQTVHEDSFLGKCKKKKMQGDEMIKPIWNVVPNPIDVSKLHEKFNGTLCILNRITFICSDTKRTHTMSQCPNLRKYHLYVIVPTKQDMLEYACSQLNADIISIRPQISSIKLNRKLYHFATRRGLCFEIQYADILNPGTCVESIHYSHLLHMYRKSENVIISSGATKSHLIRSPYDIINLGFILGLSESKSKAAILDQCQLLLLRARRRVLNKAVFVVEFTKDKTMEEDDSD